MSRYPLSTLPRRALDTLGWRNLALIGVGVAMLLDAVEETRESAAKGELLSHMLDDWLSLALGLGLLALVLLDAWRTRRELAQLQLQLNAPSHGVSGDHAPTQAAARDYGDAVHGQFDRWQLTPSEREVAVALLKGMSFQEIALLRDTREKTVRQHASSVYRKSGLGGRHELAAWFFEDLLERG